MKTVASKKRIVIIDDCQVTLAVVGDILKEAGYDVSTAQDSIYSNHLIYTVPPPDLILLDVMMPFMSGDKKVRVLKERDKSRNIPVILVSSLEEKKLQELVTSSGADGYVQKPFTHEKLLETIEHHLP